MKEGLIKILRKMLKEKIIRIREIERIIFKEKGKIDIGLIKKIEENMEILLSLKRIEEDEGGKKGKIGEGLEKGMNEERGFLMMRRKKNVIKKRGRRMMEGNIKIRKDIEIGNKRNELIEVRVGIEVMNKKKKENIEKLKREVEKISKKSEVMKNGLMIIDIEEIGDSIMRDEENLIKKRMKKFLRLEKKLVDRKREKIEEK